MKRNRDEKLMGPMFPRLHVNDADKGGGPRAPPRNKMALYEPFSIPSQKYSNSVQPQPATYLVPHQISPRNQHEKQCNQHMDFGDSLTQAEQRKKFDEDDYRVPVFDKSTSNQWFDKLCARNSGRQSTFSHGNISTRQEADDNNSKRLVDGCNDDVLHSSSIEGLKVQTGSSMDHESGDNSPTTSPRLKADDGISNSVLVENVSTLEEKKSSYSGKDLLSENQNCMRGIGNASKSGSLEQDGRVSETSISESKSGFENITPDEIVGLIGQKHFWKARSAISNQQRIFGIQVFELHRLIKVQRLIAESPDLLLEKVASIMSKPAKILSGKKHRMDSPVIPMPNISKQRLEADHQQQQAYENTPENASVSDAPNNDHQPFSGSSFCFNQLQGHHHQLLIPVISPSEGLIYKPYPGLEGFCNNPHGSNPTMGSFLTPVYGVPASPHCPLPFPAIRPPQVFFPTYGMPMMNSPALSTSSVDQTKGNSFKILAPKNGLVPDAPSEDNEVQVSTASSPCTMDSMLQLFPASPAVNGSKSENRPIKVVPRNGVSASESAARIFRSIQEERKQHASV